jgi:hypothetical protein
VRDGDIDTIREGRALEKAATPGPWNPSALYGPGPSEREDQSTEAAEQGSADRALIAWARNNLLVLLDSAERLREIDRLLAMFKSRRDEKGSGYGDRELLRDLALLE